VELFTKKNCNVTTCVNGQEGLNRLLNSGPYDLVIVDLLMSCLNGFEMIQLYHQRRSRVVNKEIIVGLLNANDSISEFIPNNITDDQSSVTVNPEDYFHYIVQKPFDDYLMQSFLMKVCEANGK
jgi:CheY-like chemotaxis protein